MPQPLYYKPMTHCPACGQESLEMMPGSGVFHTCPTTGYEDGGAAHRCHNPTCGLIVTDDPDCHQILDRAIGIVTDDPDCHQILDRAIGHLECARYLYRMRGQHALADHCNAGWITIAKHQLALRLVEAGVTL